MNKTLVLALGLLLALPLAAQQTTSGATIRDNTTPLTKLQQQNANTILGNCTGSTGNVTACTAAQAKTSLGVSCADLTNDAASCATDTTNASNISSGTLGSARGGAGTVNGVLKANGSGTVSAAVSGTDYAPATSGSSILLGNGAGGFSNYAGASCSNQFPRSLSAAGAATCASVAIGSDVSGLGTGIAAWLATPSTSNFAAAVTGETGTGAVVFGTGPTIDSPVLTGVASPAHAQGKLVYDTDNESLTFFNNDANVSLQIGQEQWIRVRNQTGSTISNGVPVYINGVSSGLPTVALAKADVGSTAAAVGLMTESCATGTICYATTLGAVRGIDTSAFTVGTVLYVSSASAGALTSTRPQPPNFSTSIGIVTVQNASTGVIHVRTGNAGQRDVLNAVVDCALDPTGTNDVTAALQACYDSFPAAGGTLFFPAGTYRIANASTITISKSIISRGAGRSITNLLTTHATQTVFTLTSGAAGAGFEQLRITASSSSLRTAGYAVDMGAAVNAYFQQSDCIYMWSCIRSAAGLQFVSDANIREFGANAANGQAVLVDAAGDRYIYRLTTDNPSDPTGAAGVRVRQCSSLVITDSNIINSGNALDIVPNGGAGTAVASVLVVNTFFDSSVIGVNILPATASDTAHRIRIVNSWFGSNTTANVRIGNGTIPNANIASIDILGSDFFSNGTTPFGLDVQGATDWSVRGSRFGGHTTNAIRVAVGTGTNDHRFNIADNLIGASLGVGANAQGITVGAGNYGPYQIIDNRGFETNTTKGIADSGAVLGTVGYKNTANNMGGLLSGAMCKIGADVTTSGTGAFTLISCRIPANAVNVGDTFMVAADGVTAASGNPTWSVAVGSSDPGTSVTWTTAAMTSATAGGGGFSARCTVKSLGVSGTITCAGVGRQLALIASSATATATTINTTADWFITGRCAMSASTFRATSAIVSVE